MAFLQTPAQEFKNNSSKVARRHISALHHNPHPPLVRRTPQPYKSGRLGECLLELLSSMVMGVEQVVCLLTARLLQISLIQFLDDRILVRLSYEAFVIALVQRFCSLRA